MDQSYFITKDDLFVPTSISRGYWVENTITGSAIASLLACCLEQRYGGPDLVITRFNIDMLGLVKSQPLAVETRKLKDGRRLKLAEASIYCDGELAARATAQFVLRTENPANPTWQAEPWRAPPPEALGPHMSFGPWDLQPIPAEYARIRKDGFSAERVVKGNEPVLGPLSPVANRQAWFRPNNPAVAGVAMTPFLRAAMVADFASPVINSSEFGIDFINTDFTLYMYRTPVGEWMGLELVSHHAQDGVAIGACWLHDVSGPLGAINLSATAQLRKKTGATPRDAEAAPARANRQAELERA